MSLDVDFVSDLNGTGDATVSAHEGSEAVHGDDAVSVNNQNPVREPTAQAKKVAPPTDDAANKPLSLRDQISSALKGEGDTPPVATQDGGVQRNPNGTFAPKVAAVLDPNAPVVEPVVAAPSTAAPAGIDPQVFASLPAETQVQLARTMEGVHASQQRFARLEPVEQLIAPRYEAWALNGVSPAQALGQLLALSDFAGRDPAGFIKHIAQNSGVDLEELVLGAEPVDPQYAALRKEFDELKNARTVEQQQQQQAAHTSVVNSVAAFATEAGQDGKPLRPYFAEVANDVLPFISAVKAQNPNWSHNQILQEAYDRACWGTPSVRSKMQAAANAAGDAERLRAGAERVDKARTASASVPSGTPTSAPAAPNDSSRSLRDTIRASMAAVS